MDQNTVIKDGMYTYRFDYDERGNVRTFTTGNGAGSTFTYDDCGLAESVSVGTADGKEILSETYRYDENGNRTKVVKTKDEQSTTTNADYNAANQLVRFGDETITYDANGNRLEDGQYRYEWNEADQLVSVTRKGESTPFVTYKYDEDGRRIQKNVNGVVTNYHYQGDSLNVLYETDADGNVVRSYIYGENGQLLAMKKGGATYFYHYNAHGDVIALTDEQGNIVARYQYDAWGNILSQSGALADENPYRYAGYQYDQETGLYYLIARYYRPEQGVFLSLDPDPGDEDDILTQNGYTYANNNPVMLVDLDGHYAHIVIIAGVGAYRVYKIYKVYKKYRKISKKYHSNSKRNPAIHHGYEIYDKKTNKVVKVGISDGRISKKGKSYRAERQVRKWHKRYKTDRYASRIVKTNIRGRYNALRWKKRHTEYINRIQPNNKLSPPFHYRP
ncbi:hypothetical protein GCA01S_100_00040 [Parageobacillus caldoxylosilyticus NBRC 107762]|uniref:Uncharacterized protein n=1 Tax=Parageobacillus caldoxylosilyticus NBRC 107762 TaxID=1220594 RepID=A0A023DKJ9_9BACL|nr:hypothetical protein GCA01S_100_00040 [Parageobacillus caldoxylosilyticus NBRC 107762]